MNGAAQPSTLIERVCAEVREPIAHALAAVEGLQRLRLPEDAGAHLDVIADGAHAALPLLDVAADLQKAEDRTAGDRRRAAAPAGADGRHRGALARPGRDRRRHPAGLLRRRARLRGDDRLRPADAGVRRADRPCAGPLAARRGRGEPAGAPGRAGLRPHRPRARQRRDLCCRTTSPACSAAVADAASRRRRAAAAS